MRRSNVRSHSPVAGIGHGFTRAAVTVAGFGRELVGAHRLAGDVRSWLRWSLDVVLYRVLRLVELPSADSERRIRLANGDEVTYRLNRGDIESLREVLIGEAYRLPFDHQINMLVDLGGHIGLTTLWFSRRYRCSRMLLVEPVPANARLARLNLARNGVNAEVIEAAVTASDGTARLSLDADSNRARIGREGLEVRTIAMASLLRQIPAAQEIDLLKIDIEGSEEVLFTGDRTWLRRVRAIISEFHPDLVDYPRLIHLLENEGFVFIPARSPNGNVADFFLRRGRDDVSITVPWVR